MATKRSKSKKGEKKKFQIEMTGLSLSLWGFFFFFLLAWIFVLGIFVGRGFLPGSVAAISDLKGQIAKLQEMVGRNHTRDPGAQKKTAPDPKLAFYEKLSNKRNEARKQPRSVEKAEPADQNAVPEKVRPEQANRANGPAGRPQAASVTPMDGLADEPKFTVQLASLGDREKAEKMINRLIARGYDAYYYEAEVKGKTYFRVRCGRFVTREEAGNYAGRLAREAGVKGFVSRIE